MDDLVAELGRRLEVGLGFRVVAAEPIVTGQINNNRLFRLTGAEGRAAVAKIYYDDDRRRLEREYGLLSFLRDRGVARVPRPLLRCDEHYAAVYSFEVGECACAADLTTEQVVRLGQVASDLHCFRPGDLDDELPLAVGACLSFAEQVDEIRRRLRLFGESVDTPETQPTVRKLCDELDPVAAVERLVEAATAGLSASAMEARPSEHELRLNTSDFAPHNVLVRPDGEVCLLDFEYAGWDDPVALTAGFVTAATSLDLGERRVEAFLRTYREHVAPSAEALARFDRVCALMHLIWCGIHLGLTTPRQLARKRFASPALDVDAVVADQITQLRRRLGLAEAAVSALG